MEMIETYNPNGGYQKLHMLQNSNFSYAMITGEPKQVPFWVQKGLLTVTELRVNYSLRGSSETREIGMIGLVTW